MPDNTPDIPEQYQGVQKDFKHSVTMQSVDDAEELFVLAKDRMLHANDWKSLVDGISAKFTVVDRTGATVTRRIHKGDYLKIDLPGVPGNVAGNGLDWVHVEDIVYDDYPDDKRESVAMTVRPSAPPCKGEDDTAHFFKSSATSTFVVQRIGKIVASAYHGRNEVPNVIADSVLDKARNAIVGAAAILGMSNLQWQALIEGFLQLPGED